MKAIALVAESQDNYPYSASGLVSLAHALSEKRFKTYLDHGQRNAEAAIALHLWNSRLSKALRFPLETVEITLRNRLHYALVERWGETWPRSPGFVAAAAPKTRSAVESAYSDLGQNAITDRIVAELSFGFWPPILRGRFVEELWKERIDRFFPNMPAELDHEAKAALIGSLLGEARNLRNRISHLEPVFKRDLSLEHSKLARLLSFACRDTAGWMKRHSTLNSVLRDGPTAMIAEPIPFKKAFKNVTLVNETWPLSEVWPLIAKGPFDFVLVGKADGSRILGDSEIGRWIRSKATDGLVDVEETPVGDLIATSPLLPAVRRTVSISELRMFLHRNKTRYVIVTETGDVKQTPLGVIDVVELMS